MTDTGLPGTEARYLYPAIKRLVDVAMAILGLAVMAIPMCFIAVIIRLSMGKPVIFRQLRPGFRERMFPCLKFRSMTDEKDQDGNLLPDARRITWFGAFLRRTSLDELPQLWNILRGDLSLVGPRPLYAAYLPYYTEAERRRHLVRPGLTGWAQVHGRNCLSFAERLKLDVWYVDHMNWRLDLQIIFKTIWIVLLQQGYAADAITLDQERMLEKKANEETVNVGGNESKRQSRRITTG